MPFTWSLGNGWCCSVLFADLFRMAPDNSVSVEVYLHHKQEPHLQAWKHRSEAVYFHSLRNTIKTVTKVTTTQR